jgi:hypothetical protein
MKRRTLSRRNDEPKKLAQDQGDLAEELAADAYDYKTFLSSNFDAARKTGAAMEVKSTVTRYQNGSRGRFRLFESQHTELVRYDRQTSARYVFVLFDVSQRPPEALMTARKPADIGHMISGLGGFNKSGHVAGPQIKIPYAKLFDV